MKKAALVVAVVLLPAALAHQPQQLNTSLTAGLALPDGQTLVSAQGIFMLGFFSNGNKKYLGIWYRDMNPQNIVWVANRDNPIKGGNGSLTLTASTLDLLDRRGNKVWSSGTFNTTSPQAFLLDSGNLIVIDTVSNNPIWQSFDQPCDTMLSDMRIGYDIFTGHELQLTSWNSTSDPSRGDYHLKLDPKRLPDVLLFQGTALIYRMGTWNGQGFSGLPVLSKINEFELITEMTVGEGSAYYSFKALDSSKWRLVMSQDGLAHRWADSVEYWHFPRDQCDAYAYCGPNAVCYNGDCKCLQEFVPKSPSHWSQRNYVGGCVRDVMISCSPVNGFYQLSHVKVPDTLNATLVGGKSLDDCRKLCLGNCSCSAYTIFGGSDCVVWSGDLVDIVQISEGINDLYTRVSDSTPSHTGQRAAVSISLLLALLIAIGVVVVGVILVLIWFRRELAFQMGIVLANDTRGENMYDQGEEHLSTEEEEIDGERTGCQHYSYQVLEGATCHFSESNKLGSGGFGTVYMGTLQTGKKVAVKRLKDSRRNIQEVEREISIVANLRHKNLVRFLGYCFETEGRFLVYEYVPNNSLEKFWYKGSFQSQKLDWATWFNIIKGVACGLRFLHDKGIIHRDLKPHNVLLDENFNPKIADFDLMRVYDKQKTHESTEKIAGTFGYMAPECTAGRKFQPSIKSDVYSYGVLVLEIMTGHKIHTFEGQNCEGLVEYVWKHWTEKKVSDVVDNDLGVERQEHALHQALRCVHVALLCVQSDRSRRPTMGQVIAMLNSDGMALQEPSLPGYVVHPKEVSGVLPCFRCT